MNFFKTSFSLHSQHPIWANNYVKLIQHRNLFKLAWHLNSLKILWSLTNMSLLTSSSEFCVFWLKSISLTLSPNELRLLSITLKSRSKSCQFWTIVDKFSIWLSIEFIALVHLRLISWFWRWIRSRDG